MKLDYAECNSVNCQLQIKCRIKADMTLMQSNSIKGIIKDSSKDNVSSPFLHRIHTDIKLI